MGQNSNCSATFVGNLAVTEICAVLFFRLLSVDRIVILPSLGGSESGAVTLLL